MEHVGSAFWGVDSDGPTMEHVGSAFWGRGSDGQTMLVMPFGCEDCPTIGQLHTCNTKYVKRDQNQCSSDKGSNRKFNGNAFQNSNWSYIDKAFPIITKLG